MRAILHETVTSNDTMLPNTQVNLATNIANIARPTHNLRQHLTMLALGVDDPVGNDLPVKSLVLSRITATAPQRQTTMTLKLQLSLPNPSLQGHHYFGERTPPPCVLPLLQKTPKRTGSLLETTMSATTAIKSLAPKEITMLGTARVRQHGVACVFFLP